jgi:hypothetical protein
MVTNVELRATAKLLWSKAAESDGRQKRLSFRSPSSVLSLAVIVARSVAHPRAGAKNKNLRRALERRGSGHDFLTTFRLHSRSPHMPAWRS